MFLQLKQNEFKVGHFVWMKNNKNVSDYFLIKILLSKAEIRLGKTKMLQNTVVSQASKSSKDSTRDGVGLRKKKIRLEKN